MNTTVQALQDLYVKLGGNLTDTYDTIADGAAVGNYVTIPDMIEACAQKAGSGGGSALPAVTADDNGSVLTVVEGEWDKAGAASAVAVIEFTLSGSTISTDKTAAEIKSLIDSGKIVMGVMEVSEDIKQQININLTNYDLSSPIMIATVYNGTSEELSTVTLTAVTINDSFTLTVGG